MHMYCTLQYKYEYSTKCIIIFCSGQFNGGGGLEHCTVQSVSKNFARLNFMGGGGLKPPQP